MIDFLEQLERDLVEAIDRPDVARAPRRMPRVRFELVAAIAAVAVAIALIALLGSQHRPTPTPVEHRTTPAPPGKVTPIPKGTALCAVGQVRRANATTWIGPASGPGGPGTMTITGRVDMIARPCCDTPRSLGRAPLTSSRSVGVTPGGEFTGCIANTVSRRPHARFVWDGIGHITAASGVFARFRNRGIGLAGETNIVLPTRARIIVDTGGGVRGTC